MSCKLNKKAYQQLIDENAVWLKANTKDCLEQNHILHVLSHSIVCYYPEVDFQAENKHLKDIINDAAEIVHNIPHIKPTKIDKEIQRAWNILDQSHCARG